MSSTFRLTLGVPKRLAVGLEELDREEFFAWCWREFAGLVGVHEGTFLSENAVGETETWTLDSAQAPRERDWVGGQNVILTDLYFSNLLFAEGARDVLASVTGLQVGEIDEQKVEDWDAQWKSHFLGSESGVVIAPFWRVIPPWLDSAKFPNEKLVRINPGAGFGTGTHETTQLCLEALGELSKVLSFDGISVLDFGSGSAILSIGCAVLGARVDAVEIDPLAIDNARENCALNSVEDRVVHSEHLFLIEKKYKLLVANILRPVLLEFADQILGRLEEGSPVVLSGLIESDVAFVVEAYSRILGRKPARILSKNEWRAIVFS